MSADFYIYTDHAQEFDRNDFEGWCKALGYEVELHPEFDLWQGGLCAHAVSGGISGEGKLSDRL